MRPKEITYIGDGDPESIARRLYPAHRVSWWIKNWQPSYEMLPLRYPTVPYLVAGVLSSNYITGQVLKLFKIRASHTFFTAKIPCMVPLGILAVFHSSREVPPVVESFKDCPICFQMKAAAVQVTAAVAHPLVLSWICCANLALRTPRAYYSDFRGNVRHIWNDMKSNPSRYLYLSLVNAVFAIAIAELQQYQTLRVLEAVRQEKTSRGQRMTFEILQSD